MLDLNVSVPQKDLRTLSGQIDEGYDLTKRIFDVVVSSFVILSVLVWLIPLIGLLIRLSSPGPVLFVQLRVGLKGRTFRCLKFRTMTYQPKAEFSQATTNDPRITPMGRFLRKTNLDEMPQFINVLIGDMSIVGPRPHPVTLAAELWNTDSNYKLRYLVKPGITGLAKVRKATLDSTGSTVFTAPYKNALRYDLLYLKRRSLLLDLKIIFGTMIEALKGNPHVW